MSLCAGLMNLVKMGSFWPQGRGAQLDMIFSVAFACTGCALTTMAHLREHVSGTLTPAVNSLSTWWWIAETGRAQRRGLLLSLSLPASTSILTTYSIQHDANRENRTVSVTAGKYDSVTTSSHTVTVLKDRIISGAQSRYYLTLTGKKPTSS